MSGDYEVIKTMLQKMSNKLDLLEKRLNVSIVKEETSVQVKPKEYKIKAITRKETIRKINDLRKAGATCKEIAEALNAENIETISGIGKWHTQSVHRYIKKKRNNYGGEEKEKRQSYCEPPRRP